MREGLLAALCLAAFTAAAVPVEGVVTMGTGGGGGATAAKRLLATEVLVDVFGDGIDPFRNRRRRFVNVNDASKQGCGIEPDTCGKTGNVCFPARLVSRPIPHPGG